MKPLSDTNHPLVQLTARKLTSGVTEPRVKLARIFYYVRDEIQFGFPPEGDFVTASQTIKRGYGQCNTKGTLFLALCRAVGIPARLHFSRISKEIQHGFFVGIFYALMPKEVTHSWLEVKVDGHWIAIDNYINDLVLHKAAVLALKQSGWTTGFSVSRKEGEPSAELELSGKQFSQMGAVVYDDGTCDEPADFFSGPYYLNRPGIIKRALYRLYLPLVNRRVRLLRQTTQPEKMHNVSSGTRA